jgi:hypothetical protein
VSYAIYNGTDGEGRGKVDVDPVTMIRKGMMGLAMSIMKLVHLSKSGGPFQRVGLGYIAAGALFRRFARSLIGSRAHSCHEAQRIRLAGV